MKELRTYVNENKDAKNLHERFGVSATTLWRFLKRGGYYVYENKLYRMIAKLK